MISNTNVATVVMIPINKLAQARNTNAELDILNRKLAGYISGIEAHLKH